MLAQVQAVAEAPLPALPPCDDKHLAQCLRAMQAVLPRQHSDELTGELFVRTYQRQLGSYPNAALSYLAQQATARCKDRSDPAGHRRHDRGRARGGAGGMIPWRPHTSNRCPVAGDRMVRPRIECLDRATAEKREFTQAKGWRWTRTGSAGDIAEYQVQA